MLFLFSILLIINIRFIETTVMESRYQQAREAAALRAASDLSQIVVDDPNFGFVSLSDRPAVGLAAMSGDGEPLPVHGINTLIATARLDYIIAKETGNTLMEDLALQDAKNAQEAAESLTKVLARAIKPGKDDKTFAATDMDGNVVRPYEDAIDSYRTCLKCFTGLEGGQFELKLGWLNQSGITVTPIPEPKQYLPAGAQNDGCYEAYKDVPVSLAHFYFASLGSQPALVSGSRFREGSYQHLSSVVKVESTRETRNLLPWENKPIRISGQACAQAYAVNCQPGPSILVAAFPDGLPIGVNSIGDLIGNQGLNMARMKNYIARGGDFSVDPQSYLEPNGTDMEQASAADEVTHALYDWLRSNYLLPRVDSMISILNRPFTNTRPTDEEYIYVVSITAEGNGIVSKLSLNPFTDLRVSENQAYAINNNPVQLDDSNWTVVCRDQVRTLGTINGGKHAGQPLPGNPVNWGELKSYVDEPFIKATTKRKLRGISLIGKTAADGGIALANSELIYDDGKMRPRTLRKSCYSGGMAVEFRISSPMAAN